MAGPKILVVENDEIVALDLGRRLARLGYSSLTAANGGEALALTARVRPDLVLMDIKLEGGFEGRLPDPRRAPAPRDLPDGVRGPGHGPERREYTNG